MEVNPRTSMERLYAIGTLLLAFIVIAVVPPRITTLMTSYQAVRAEQNAQFAQLTTFLREQHIPRALAVRVQRSALNAARLKQKRTPEGNIYLLTYLSDTLREQLHCEMFSPLLVKHCLFSRLQQQQEGILSSICHKAVSTLELSEYDVLFKPAEFPDEPVMFFLVAGELRYTRGLDVPGPTEDVQTGSYLSEAALWTRWVHVGGADVNTNSTLLMVKALAAQDILVKSILHECIKYATFFVKALNNVRPEDLTDLDCVDVRSASDEAFGLPPSVLSRESLGFAPRGEGRGSMGYIVSQWSWAASRRAAASEQLQADFLGDNGDERPGQ